MSVLPHTWKQSKCLFIVDKLMMKLELTVYIYVVVNITDKWAGGPVTE